MRTALALAILVTSATLLAGCTSSDPGDDDAGPEPSPSPSTGAKNVTWGDVATATIRPGASLGGYCSLNFLFTDDEGWAYIGTAGHCTEQVGERVQLGPGPEFGTVAFDSDTATGVDDRVDFSLIRLDADQVANAHPRMIGQDGPTGSIDAGEAAPGDLLAVYGHGMVFGQNEASRPRQGALVEEDGETYRADMPAVQGDSGAPLIHLDTGKAFGIISHFGLAAVPPSTDEGPIMPFILQQLDNAGMNVTLATV